MLGRIRPQHAKASNEPPQSVRIYSLACSTFRVPRQSGDGYNAGGHSWSYQSPHGKSLETTKTMNVFSCIFYNLFEAFRLLGAVRVGKRHVLVAYRADGGHHMPRLESPANRGTAIMQGATTLLSSCVSMSSRIPRNTSQ